MAINPTTRATVQIGDHVFTVRPDGISADSRIRFRYEITSPTAQCIDTDLHSGAGYGRSYCPNPADTAKGMASLLSFVGHALESGPGDTSFPEDILENLDADDVSSAGLDWQLLVGEVEPEEWTPGSFDEWRLNYAAVHLTETPED